MSKLTVIILLVFANISFAEDFRGIAYGESCQNLVTHEMNLGSKQYGERKGQFIGKFVYQGVQIEKEALITYRCNENDLFERGMVLYTSLSPQEAEDLFSEWSTLLMDVHGSPIMVSKADKASDYPVIMNWKRSNTSEHIMLGWTFEDSFAVVFSKALE